MASFWRVFSFETPERSNTLTLVEGKILHMMFFVIYISVVAIENWLIRVLKLTIRG